MRRKDTQPDSGGRRETRGLEVPHCRWRESMQKHRGVRWAGGCHEGTLRAPLASGRSHFSVDRMSECLACGLGLLVPAGPPWQSGCWWASEGVSERPRHILPSGSESSST